MAKAKIVGQNWNYYTGCCGGGYFLPVALIFIGGYYLARSQGLFPANFPFWSSLIFILGVALLLKRLMYKR